VKPIESFPYTIEELDKDDYEDLGDGTVQCRRNRLSKPMRPYPKGLRRAAMDREQLRWNRHFGNRFQRGHEQVPIINVSSPDGRRVKRAHAQMQTGGGLVLRGWNAIRSYLGVSHQTAVNYYNDWGLPVLRTMHKRVWTTSGAIDRWIIDLARAERQLIRNEIDPRRGQKLERNSFYARFKAYMAEELDGDEVVERREDEVG
jgi:hypothetical protein